MTSPTEASAREADPAEPAVEMPTAPAAERKVFALPGAPMFLVGLVLLVLGGLAIPAGAGTGRGGTTALGVLLVLLALLTFRGLLTVNPGEARVVQLFGRYTGTVRRDGWCWVNPFSSRRVSTRIRNHETAVMKVNDSDGNPIEIATVVVWQVADTARAVFAVDDFIRFVGIQTETAVRHIANSYPYDNHETDGLSLRDNADEITEKLCTEIATRVRAAGVRVVESRITHLAYAPEIAQAMLQRQQAGAVVAARQRIVEGAVGMVQLALQRIAEHEVVELDEERKAAMVSNLLVVLCGERATQPVLNTGSLYQ
jgi:regulator of protease activity HflC (stomatin/prohibitin superfamily)